jgi:Phage-related protein
MWNVVMYSKENGDIPVKEFLDGLPAKHRAKAFWEIELLEEFGSALGMPYVRHIDGKLWELRIKFASDISRIFYFVPIEHTIMLLHGFTKKSQKTPDQEISTARSNLTDYERRERK